MTGYRLFSQHEPDQGVRRRRVRLPGNVPPRLFAVVLALAVVALAGCGSGSGSPSAAAAHPAGMLTEFPLPQSALIPAAITAGPDGNLWFTDPCASPDEASDCSGSQIGRITPGGNVTEFPLPTTGLPEGIAAGPDGNLWFTVSRVDDTSMIDRITPGGDIRSFPLPRLLVGPADITAGPDGNLWFTEATGSQIGRITPDGQITEFPLPTADSDPIGITTGSDGNLWFTESQSGTIGRITLSGQITEFPADASGGIAAGSDGNLWFTEVGQIGRITPAGKVTQFPLQDAQSAVEGIASGSDGNIWFTGCTPNDAASDGCIHTLVGRITPAGKMTTFALPVGTAAFGITTGPDKNLWFTENNSSDLGRMTSGK